MRLLRSGAILFALMLGASVANAAGLGKLTVNSGLGQVLNAEIDLVSLQPGELDSLSARVATVEAFRDSRIEYSPALRLLRFSVERRVNGQAYLKVTSVAPINEPFVDMLIEVTWPAGRILREYPILLDPPGYSQSRVAPPTSAAPPQVASRPTETPPASAPAASSQAPAAATTTAPGGGPSSTTELTTTAPTAPSAPKETPASGDTYGPIQKGETLAKIAEQTKPADVSLEQMLVALYRENQGAFINNNMNRMKTGQILRVPSAEEVNKIEKKDANTEYRTHVADWRAYRDQVAGGVPSLPPRDTGTSATGRVTSAAVTPPAPPSAEPKDVLKLSKSDAAAKAGGAGAGKGASQDRLNALQEEVTAKDKALRESQSRVADLEKQIQQMQRLLDLKGGAPAAKDVPPAKAGAPSEPAKPVEPPKVAATTTPPAPAKVEAPKAEPPKAEPPKVAEVKPTEPPKTDTKVAEAPKPPEPAKPAPPKADAKAPPKKAAPPAEKSFTDELLDNPWYLAAGLGGLAILGAGAFLFLRRRKDRAEAGPSSSMTSAFPSDLKPEANTGKSGGGLVDTGNSSFLTDFDKTGPGTIDTDEVDPVAEAEVYIAYGRDAQAEEILKEAMARDASRTEIPLKLLEIYHARKSATAFETVAKELKAKVGDGPQWQKAAAMGAQIDPNNPLYAGAGGSGTYTAVAPAAKPDVDFDIAGQSGAASAAPAPDFNLGDEPPKPDIETSVTPSSAGMDFDIGGGTPSTPAPAAAPKSETPSSFDFDLSGLELSGTKPAAGGTDLEVDPTQRSQPAGSSGLNLADLSLDSPGGDAGGGGGGGGGGEGVGTKLELAKAYLEIGDKDGARDILQEVAKEGNSAQKEEAQKLIASL